MKGNQSAKIALSVLCPLAASLIGGGVAVAQQTTTLPGVTVDVAAPPAGVPGGAGGGADDADPSTKIDGYVAEGTSTATKTNTPLREVPQSVSVVTRDQIEDRGAATLGEAIGYSAGVAVSPFGLDSRYDQFIIRGFEQNTTGVYRDGLRLPVYSFTGFRIEPQGVDHIDVLRGPTSVLYGLNNPGGLVNIVSKTPPDKAFGEVWASYGSNDNFQTGFDVGGPVDPKGEFSYRITGLGRNADTQVDFVEDDRLFIAPSLTWRPSAATTLTILGQYQKDDTGDTFQILPLEGTLKDSPFGKIPRSRFLGEPDFSKFEGEDWSIGYQFEHKFGSGVTARQNLRYDHAEVFYNTLYGAGQFDPALVGQPLLLRFAQQADQEIDLFQVDNQIQIDSRFERIENTFLAGVDYANFTGRSKIGFAGVGNAANPLLPAFDPFNPTYGQFFFFNTGTGAPIAGDRLPLFQNQEQTQEALGLYFQDQIKFDKQWVLTLSGRQDWVQSDIANKATEINPAASEGERDDEAFTGRAGLSYLFENGLTPYVSYSTSFFPNIAFTASGATLEPETGEQYEAGVKYQPAGFKSYAIASVFDLTKQNVTQADPGVPNAFIQTGEVQVQGVEFEVVADLDNGWKFLGAYSHFDAEVTDDANLAIIGNRPVRIPKNLASAWADYTFREGWFKGLGAGFGVRYVGNTFGDEGNRLNVPSYTLYDAAVRYEWDQWKLSLNVSNVFDDDFVGTCGEIADPTGPGDAVAGYDYCSYGKERTATLRLGYKW